MISTRAAIVDSVDLRPVTAGAPVDAAEPAVDVSTRPAATRSHGSPTSAKHVAVAINRSGEVIR